MACPHSLFHFATLAIHGRKTLKERETPLLPDISSSTTYKKLAETGRNPEGCSYTRGTNPTRRVLEESIAALENGKYGLCFASGLAAVDCVMHLLSAGDHLIYSKEIYVGTSVSFTRIFPKHGIEVTEVDPKDPENFNVSIKSNTKMIWIETPSNPHLVVTDIVAVVEIAKRRNGILVVADNTFMSPYFQNPLAFGVDIVMHSATKFLGGHSDALMGALVTNNNSLYQELLFLQEGLGGVPSPFDCYLILRGIKTLHLRMDEHMKNSLAVAQFLENHPQIEKVIHTGLSSHPQYSLHLRQSRGHSGMLAVFVKGGADNALKILKHLKVFTFATSLGGPESLVMHLASTIFADFTEEERLTKGIVDNLLRISIGIEDVADLIQDLDQALQATYAKK